MNLGYDNALELRGLLHEYLNALDHASRQGPDALDILADLRALRKECTVEKWGR